MRNLRMCRPKHSRPPTLADRELLAGAMQSQSDLEGPPHKRHRVQCVPLRVVMAISELRFVERCAEFQLIFLCFEL